MKPATFFPYGIFLAFLFLSNLGHAQPLWMPDSWKWVARASMNEGRSYFPAVAAENGKVYVFGGGTSISTSLNTIEEYSKDQDEWVVLNYTLPQPMCAMAAVELNGAIYIIGGASTYIGLETSKVYRFYPDTGFDEDTIASLPAARAFLSACTTPDGRIVVTGGTGGASGATQNTVYIYDPSNNQWDTSPYALNVARAAHTSVVVGHKIYVIGGTQSFSTGMGINSVEVLDLDNPEAGWVTDPANLLSPRVLHGSVALYNKIVTLGGIESITTAAMDMEGYAPEKAGGDTWETFGTLEYDRRAFGCVRTSDTTVLIMGGNSGSSLLASTQEPTILSASHELLPNPLENPAALFPNTPNPFDQRTEIAFAVSRPADITISLFDATGQRISTLVSGRYGTGEYHIPVDGASLEPGIYFCVMHSNTGLPSTQKWVVLR
ncbi:MAG: T9SS type A sorting domain-containing protein [Saprospirales bacterium]|nr:T9SS type A sorting domain-containing protein [Saprospirales bacterium]